MKPELIHFAMLNSALVRPIGIARKVIGPSVRLTFPLINYRAFSKLQAKTLYLDNDYFEQYYKESCQMSFNTLIQILKENMSFEIPNQFKNAKAKILITVGAKEKSIMKKSEMDFVTNNENCKGVIVSDVGHGVSLAMPKFFNEMLENWIKNGTIPNNIVSVKNQVYGVGKYQVVIAP